MYTLEDMTRFNIRESYSIDADTLRKLNRLVALFSTSERRMTKSGIIRNLIEIAYREETGEV